MQEIKLKDTLSIHPDLDGMLFFNTQNINFNSIQQFLNSVGVHFYSNFDSIFDFNEPSLIDVSLEVKKGISLPPAKYGISYSRLTPSQRYDYLEYLSNPYVQSPYAILLFYGLERHLLCGNFERACEIIIKLRESNKNKRFQEMSAHSLILSAIIRKDIRYIDRLTTKNINPDLFFLCAYSFDRKITSSDIVFFSDCFGFSDNKYLHCDKSLFEIVMNNYLSEINLKDIVNISNLPVSYFDFYNHSIYEKRPFPCVSQDVKLQSLVRCCIEKVNDDHKQLFKKIKKELNERKLKATMLTDT